MVVDKRMVEKLILLRKAGDLLLQAACYLEEIDGSKTAKRLAGEIDKMRRDLWLVRSEVEKEKVK